MKIQTFKIQQQIDNHEVILYPTLLAIKGKNYLVDCGYEETFLDFVAELKNLGIELTDLYAILISHDDIDHLGALKLFKDNHPDLIIYCSEIEEPSVSGKTRAERLEQAEQLLSKLPQEHQSWALQFIHQLKSIKRVAVDGFLKDRDKIEGEMEVVFTPGHTKGHVSFYIPGEKVMIANDALVIENDRFDIANPMFTLDMEQALKSVELIREFRAEKIICYHGGIAKDHIYEKLTDLINRYKTPQLT